MNENKEPLHRKVIYFEGESDEGQVEVAMQWNGSYQESTFSFANNINTHEGGTHMSGFRSALTRTLNAYARGKNILKENGLEPGPSVAKAPGMNSLRCMQPRCGSATSPANASGRSKGWWICIFSCSSTLRLDGFGYHRAQPIRPEAGQLNRPETLPCM